MAYYKKFKKTPVIRSCSALQVRRAYEKHYGSTMPDTMTYQDAACKMAKDMGGEESANYISSMSNDPTLQD